MIEVLNQTCPLDCVNDTFITPIPKVKFPQKVGNYIPISLCNVIYKIIAKVLANRLKFIMLEVISPNQSGFVFGRLITNNVLIAYETLNSLTIKGQVNNRFMALKLDMRKAYDKVK